MSTKDTRWVRHTMKQTKSYEARKEIISASDLYPLSTTELNHFDTEHLVLDEFGEPGGENFKNE